MLFITFFSIGKYTFHWCIVSFTKHCRPKVMSTVTLQLGQLGARNPCFCGWNIVEVLGKNANIYHHIAIRIIRTCDFSWLFAIFDGWEMGPRRFWNGIQLCAEVWESTWRRSVFEAFSGSRGPGRLSGDYMDRGQNYSKLKTWGTTELSLFWVNHPIIGVPNFDPYPESILKNHRVWQVKHL